ncbi:MAG: hypothetical protein PVSMB2_07560 [Ktedonobacteraceae bacterium]
MCNGIKREDVKASPDLASGFSVIHRYTKFGMASNPSQFPLAPTKEELFLPGYLQVGLLRYKMT